MVMCYLWWFFFFKQKTAYEMRISDWSSDVCSSDLVAVDIEIEERLVGTFTAARVGDSWVAGFGAPMGGADFVRPDEPPAAVIGFVRELLDRATQQGVRRIELRSKPPHHGAAESHLQFVLLNLGAVIDLANLSFFVHVRDPGV